MFEAGLVLLFLSFAVIVFGFTAAPYDWEDFCLGLFLSLLLVALSLMFFGGMSEKKAAGVKFRSMYEIASPCRLHDVDWCDGGECQVVIRCSDVKGVKE